MSAALVLDISTLAHSPAQNPAFGPAQIRGLTEVFVEKAYEVCICSAGLSSTARIFVLWDASDT